jgi:RNA methyltransferase, TrmH family
MLVKSQVKYIQSLGQKKFRQEESAFVAEGPKLIAELLQATHVPAKMVFATKSWIDENRKQVERLAAVQVLEISQSELERISGLATPHQVLGLFGFPHFPPSAVPPKRILALDNIQDPGNLGTIIRIADWFGLAQIRCSEQTADAFNPKVVQASMGSICRVEVSYGKLEEFITQQASLPVYASTLDGQSVYGLGPIEEGIIVIGNESVGIHPDLLRLASQQISIPRQGHAESLNAAVATGILLSHLLGPTSLTRGTRAST